MPGQISRGPKIARLSWRYLVVLRRTTRLSPTGSGFKVLTWIHGYIKQVRGHGTSLPLRRSVIKVQGGCSWQWRALCHISHWLSTAWRRSPARCLEQSLQIVGLRLDNLQGFNGSQICLPSECTSQSHLAIVLPSNTIIELELALLINDISG